MERTFSPMVRQFSAIAGLQQAYTLVYSLDPDGETGCRLTLCRTGSSQRMDSKYMAVAPEFGYRVLQYLCENGVQPEIWQAVDSGIRRMIDQLEAKPAEGWTQFKAESGFEAEKPTTGKLIYAIKRYLIQQKSRE